MYSAIDMLVVGRFASAADLSGVSTGSQILQTITKLIVSFVMGITVNIGQLLGAGKSEKIGKTIGSGILLFIRCKELPFTLRKKDFHWDRHAAGRIVRVGFPIALQDFLVSMSFIIILVILAIVF